MATIPRQETTSTVAKQKLKTYAGVLYQPNCRCFLLTVKDTSATAIDLRAEDDASNYDWNSDGTATIAVETVEAIISEINPLAYFTTNSAAGTMMLIMDANITTSDLQTRIRGIGKDAGADTTSIGPNDVDISGSTVQDVAVGNDDTPGANGTTNGLTTDGTVVFTAAS